MKFEIADIGCNQDTQYDEWEKAYKYESIYDKVAYTRTNKVEGKSGIRPLLDLSW